MANCYLSFDCVGQDLQRTDENIIAEGAINAIEARFTVSEEWTGLSIYARFSYGKEVYDVQLIDGVAIVPFEVLRLHGFEVALYGEDGTGKRLTSAAVIVPVAKSLSWAGSMPQPAPPSIIKQFVDSAAAAASIAQSVRDDADAGEFNGLKGDTGEKGDTGADGLTTTVEIAGSTYTHTNGTITIPDMVHALKKTQAQYDAIATKDDNTVYMIVGQVV